MRFDKTSNMLFLNDLNSFKFDFLYYCNHVTSNFLRIKYAKNINFENIKQIINVRLRVL